MEGVYLKMVIKSSCDWGVRHDWENGGYFQILLDIGFSMELK
jgi:hypothetical protein